MGKHKNTLVKLIDDAVQALDSTRRRAPHNGSHAAISSSIRMMPWIPLLISHRFVVPNW